jgi:hypothetical protein
LKLSTTNLHCSTFLGKSIDLKSEKPIFDSGYSPVSLLIMGCSFLFCTALLFFAFLYIRHYPVTVSLLSLFVLRIMIDAKVERLVVMEDRLVIVTRRLLPFMTRRQVVLFSIVESIDIRPGCEMLLVQYKGGDCREFSPSIHADQFQKAVGIIRTLAYSNQDYIYLS